MIGCEVIVVDKLEKLLDDIRVLEGDLERVEHEGVKNVIRNMIAGSRWLSLRYGP